jgi:acetyltransferase-like isoleucine patch superfamily enzyme
MVEAGTSGSSASLPGTAVRPFRLLLVRWTLGLLPPFVLDKLRTRSLRWCGVDLGAETFFWGMPVLRGAGPGAGRLRIGTVSGLNDGCVFDLAAPVTLGDHVSVGHQVRFLTSERAPSAGSTQPASITIGDGAWLGARCTILGGVTVGAGSVIGAGVTLAADVPPHTMVTGSQSISLARWR